jgi:hypothetical protein
MNTKMILAAIALSLSLAACAKKEEAAAPEAAPAETAAPAEAPAADTAAPAETAPADTAAPADGSATPPADAPAEEPKQ